MRKSLITLIFLAIVLMAFGSETVSAQTSGPQMLVNWQAGTYVPPGFFGKALPTSESKLVASVDLFDQGKRVDLSSIKIQWYINDNYYQGGTGITRINLNAPSFIGKTSIQLRVSMPNYGGGIGKTVLIPVVSPEAVIGTSAPSLSIAATPFILQANPFFFNVKDPSELQFYWVANNTTQGFERSFTVNRQLSQSGGAVSLELQVLNPLYSTERLARKITLFP